MSKTSKKPEIAYFDADLCTKYLLKAQQKIFDIIHKKNAGNKTKKMAETVFDLTAQELHEKYAYKEPLDALLLEKQKKRSEYHLFADFWGFHYTATSVPFYHSLGDTLGYHNGHWEFNYNIKNAPPEYTNELIYEFISLGGVNDISIVNWLASDDSIMYMATYNVLLKNFNKISDFGSAIRTAYLDILPKIEQRHGGITTMRSLETQKLIKWDKLPYNRDHNGSGTSMRTGCIGLFYPGKDNRGKLIAFSIEASRVTHNSAVGMLGGLVSALFTAYAIEKTNINKWPHKLLKLFKSNRIDKYMQESRPNDYKFYVRDKDLFIKQWENYVNMRFSGLTPRLDMKNLKNPVERYRYFSANYSKGHESFAGACADDSVIMAYDALLESGDNIEKIIVYSILHPGDSDTVGCIALSWFGAYYQSPKNDRLVFDKFERLEMYEDIYDSIDKSMKKMIKVFYYDLYLSTAIKVIKQMKFNT